MRLLIGEADIAKVLSGETVMVQINNYVTALAVMLNPDDTGVNNPEEIYDRAIIIADQLKQSRIPHELKTYGDHVTLSVCGVVVYSSIGNMISGIDIDAGLTFAECRQRAETAISSAMNNIMQAEACEHQPA